MRFWFPRVELEHDCAFIFTVGGESRATRGRPAARRTGPVFGGDDATGSVGSMGNNKQDNCP
jgi:hypothetical protein